VSTPIWCPVLKAHPACDLADTKYVVLGSSRSSPRLALVPPVVYTADARANCDCDSWISYTSAWYGNGGLSIAGAQVSWSAEERQEVEGPGGRVLT